MKRVTDALGATELVEKLTLEAVNLFYLGGKPDDPEVSKLEATITLVAEAWGLPQESVDKNKNIIETEREVTRREAQGEPTQGVIPKEDLLQTDGSNEILAVLWGLFETAVRLDTQEKRELVLQSAQYMAEYLGLEEWITDINRPTTRKLV